MSQTIETNKEQEEKKKRIDSLSDEIQKRLAEKMGFIRTGKLTSSDDPVRVIIVK